MPVTIYHNPRCTKSRQTLQLLQERNVDLAIIEYLKTPPDAETLTQIIEMLDMEPRELMRTGEEAYKLNGLDDENLTREQLIAAMVDNPALIQRPIVVAGSQARVGRPPEHVLEILPG